MRIAIAMSGGVDSSVAAAVLKAQGHDVVGLTMKLWACSDASPEGKAREAELLKKTRADVCCSPKDILDAKAVCATLDIPHYVLEMAETFSSLVVDQFIDDYARGRTPNPCVRCNERVKSKGLVEKARELNCEKLATGHYARIETNPQTGQKMLLMGRDPTKDQSYFLFPLTQEELRYLHFPLGDVEKHEVRRIAQELGLVVADKPESMEICFVKDNDHRRFLKDKIPHAFKPGPILHENGTVLGQHLGLTGYTIGQRKGIGVAYIEPLYVIQLDMENNALILGPDSSLFTEVLEAEAMHWIAGHSPAIQFKAEAKIRYKTPPTPCEVNILGSGQVQIVFDKPVRAATPGQALVITQGHIVLGGGWITSVGQISIR